MKSQELELAEQELETSLEAEAYWSGYSSASKQGVDL